MLATIITADNARTFLAEEGMTDLPDTMTHDALVNMAVKVSGAQGSQSKYATFLINVTQGNIDAGTITAALREAFPGAKVGDRHGPHYASLSRVRPDGTRKLKGARYEVPKTGRTTGPKMADLKRENATLRSILDAVAGAKTKADITKAMAPYLAMTATAED